MCILERQLADGLAEMLEAVELNPEFYEAHYQAACIAAVLGEEATAIASLKSAIEGDPRYFERVKNDPVFDQLRFWPRERQPEGSQTCNVWNK